jgi:hypothetical protein
MAEKKINVAGFTKDLRLEELEKIKTKYSKKGYNFIDYSDDGITKSFATFEVDDKTLARDNLKKVAIWAVVIIIIGIWAMPDSPTYDNYKDTTLKDAKRLKLTQLKDISSSYVESKEIPSSYNQKFYDCLGNLIYDKDETFTIEKMLGWCYEDYTLSSNNQMKEYYNTAELLANFNPFDGSYYPLENIIKNRLMKNPSSYEHIKTVRGFVYYGAERPHMFLSTQFRGTNDFGGIVTQRVYAKVDAVTKELYDMEIE